MGILLNSSTMLAAEATTEIYGDGGTIVQNYGDLVSSGLPRPEGATALKIYRKGTDAWEPFEVPGGYATRRAHSRAPAPRGLPAYGRARPLATAEEDARASR